jgi:hypothetical protein
MSHTGLANGAEKANPSRHWEDLLEFLLFTRRFINHRCRDNQYDSPNYEINGCKQRIKIEMIAPAGSEPRCDYVSPHEA